LKIKPLCESKIGVDEFTLVEALSLSPQKVNRKRQRVERGRMQTEKGSVLLWLRMGKRRK
jgi:hypothetical protein